MIEPTGNWPDGMEPAEPDRFLLKHDGSGAQRTNAFLLSIIRGG
jgi:hypothetical protein